MVLAVLAAVLVLIATPILTRPFSTVAGGQGPGLDPLAAAERTARFWHQSPDRHCRNAWRVVRFVRERGCGGVDGWSVRGCAGCSVRPRRVNRERRRFTMD